MQKWAQSIRRSRYYRGNTLLALVLNLIFAESLLFVMGYLWFVQRTKIPLLSLILTLIVLGLLTMAFVLRYKKYYSRKKTEARRKVGRESLAEELKQLSSDEFQWQIMRLLLQLEDITDIKSSGDFLETTLQGRKTAIGCYHAGVDETLSPRRLADFLNRAKLEGYPQALYVTSGVYAEACREMANKKSSFQVQLLDIEDLLDQMEHAGMFPDEKTIDGLVDKKITSRQEKLQAVKREIMTPKRIRTYLGYSLFFYVLSRLFDQMSLYYLVVAVVFLLLALLVWFYGRRHPIKLEKQEQLLKSPAP